MLATPQLIELLRRESPSVVFFANAGGPAQIREAHRGGACVFFLTVRPNTRQRIFGPGCVAGDNEPWVADPMRPLTVLERLVLRLRPQVRVRSLDPLVATASDVVAVIVTHALAAALDPTLSRGEP